VAAQVVHRDPEAPGEDGGVMEIPERHVRGQAVDHDQVFLRPRIGRRHLQMVQANAVDQRGRHGGYSM
jgi:hypothetical protein